MFLTLNTPSVSQVFFSFYKRLYYYKVTVNLKEQSLPPLWQSSKRGAFSKLPHATYKMLWEQRSHIHVLTLPFWKWYSNSVLLYTKNTCMCIFEVSLEKKNNYLRSIFFLYINLWQEGCTLCGKKQSKVKVLWTYLEYLFFSCWK